MTERPRDLATPAGALAFFVALTVLMTWPQARYLGTRAVDHHDIFFNM